ncbi:MAG: hypothetical protein HY854_16625 [Burkholderiales bacterium]|nr:hypothetical protein [Burkholderiales bacterium]
MTTGRTIALLDSLSWIFVYAGLFMVVIGLAVAGADATVGWSLGVVGALATTAGVVLIWLRSRLAAAGAKSAPTTPESKT